MNCAANNKVKNVKYEDVKSPENNQAETPVENTDADNAAANNAQPAEDPQPAKAEKVKVKKERKHPFRDFAEKHPKTIKALKITGLVALGGAAAGAGAYGIHAAANQAFNVGVNATQNATTKVLADVAVEGVKAIPADIYCKAAIENLVKAAPEAAAKVAEQLPTIAGHII